MSVNTNIRSIQHAEWTEIGEWKFLKICIRVQNLNLPRWVGGGNGRAWHGMAYHTAPMLLLLHRHANHFNPSSPRFLQQACGVQFSPGCWYHSTAFGGLDLSELG